MDPEDVARFQSEQAAAIAGPLVGELVEHLEIDLRANDSAALRMLVDLSLRIYQAGFNAGMVEATAQIIQQAPPNTTVTSSPPTPVSEGPLGTGTGLDWPGLFEEE